MTGPKTTERKLIDWEAVAREYRAGQLSVREIGRLHDVSHVAIAKRAKAEGWARDLTKRVREAVTTKLVTEAVTSAGAEEAVETAAQRAVEVVRQHRADIGSARQTCAALLAELQAAGERQAELQDAIEAETAEDKTASRRTSMLRAVSLGSRSSTLSNLAGAMRNLIGLERAAFSLDAKGDGSRDAERDAVAMRDALKDMSDDDLEVLRTYYTHVQRHLQAPVQPPPQRRRDTTH